MGKSRVVLTISGGNLQHIASDVEANFCWKGSVGGQWVYTHESRRAKKLIPVKSFNSNGWSVSVSAHLWPAAFWRGVGRFGHRRQIRPH